MSEPTLILRGALDVARFLSAVNVPTDEPAQILLGLAVHEDDHMHHVIVGAAVRSGDTISPLTGPMVADLAAELMVETVVIVTVNDATTPDPRAAFWAVRPDCPVGILDWLQLDADAWQSVATGTTGPYPIPTT